MGTQSMLKKAPWELITDFPAKSLIKGLEGVGMRGCQTGGEE